MTEDKMAIGKNLKKTSKKLIPEKKEEKTVIETEAKEETTAKPQAPSIPKRDSAKESLNQLNHDLEAAPNVEENSRMLVVFPVGQEEYAFDISQIKEVVPVPPISSVPQTEGHILGVANVRGNVLAVIDLAKKFGAKKGQSQDDLKYVIVIKSEEVKVAVASSQVPETLMINESLIDSTADVMRKTSSEQSFIKGVVKRDHRMIILIDILEMVNEGRE